MKGEECEMPQRYFGQTASIVCREGLSLEMRISLPGKGGRVER